MAPQPRVAPAPAAPMAPVVNAPAYVPAAPVITPPAPARSSAIPTASEKTDTRSLSSSSIFDRWGNLSTSSIFDRWGNLFAEAPGRTPAGPGVGSLRIVSADKASGAVLQTTTSAKGVFTLGKLAPGTHEIVLSGRDLASALKVAPVKGDGPPEIIAVLIALLLPPGAKSRETSRRQVAHVFQIGPDQLVRVSIDIPQDGSGKDTAVTWTDPQGKTTRNALDCCVASGDVNGDGVAMGRVVRLTDTGK